MSVVLDRLTALLEHRRIDGDDESNAILDALIGGIADAADRLGLVAFGDPDSGISGAQFLRDPRYAPIWALAHAAQYTGGILPARHAGESDDDYIARARDAVVYPLGIKRGTHEAIRRTIEPLLTGAKTVIIQDNFGGDYGILVRTVASETPDPEAVRIALEGDYVSSGRRGAINAEMVLTYLTDDVVEFAEATVNFNDLPVGVTGANVTRTDVT